PPGSSMNRRLPWWPWLTLFVFWSLLLITPGTWFGVKGVSQIVEMGAGKLLHAGVYAVLAGAAGWLPGSSPRRLLIALLLIAHGELTESIQLSVPGRTGS